MLGKILSGETMLGFEIKCLLNDNKKCIDILAANLVQRDLTIDDIINGVININVVIIPDLDEYHVKIFVNEQVNKIVFGIYEVNYLGKLEDVNLIRNDDLVSALSYLALTHFYEKEAARNEL